MKLLKSYRSLFCVVLLLIGNCVAVAQQKRQTPRPPVRKAPPPAAAPVSTPTFDTLLANDKYKLYVEVRGIGQLIKSNSMKELLEPVIKLAAPPKELKTLLKSLDAHADEVMTSRLMLATWPTTSKLAVPDALFALEFDSAEEAGKFVPELTSVLQKVLPTQTPTPSESPAEKSSEVKTSEPVQPSPNFYVKQVGSLILITPTPLTLKNLRPPGSKLLTENPSFRTARNRFTSEQIFLFLDVNGIEKEQQTRVAEEAMKTAEQPGSIETVAEENREAEVKEPDNFTLQVDTVDLVPSPQPTPDPISTAVGSFASSFFGGVSKFPDGVGLGVSFEADSFDLRALMVNAPGEKSDVVPWLPNLIPGPPIVPESPAILPADTELFATVSLDLPQILGAMSRQPPILNEGQSTTTVRANRPEPFAEIESRLKIKIKEDLLPLLGSEIVVSMPVSLLSGGPGFMSRQPAVVSPQPPPEVTTTEVKRTSESTFVVAVSLKDREGMQILLPKIIDGLGFAGASLLATKERREDTEMVSYGNMFAYAFIGNFLVLSSDAAATRHVVDAYLKNETLASDMRFKNYTRWQPRQLQAQVYVSPALMESFKTWADQPGFLMSDQTREILSRLTLVPEPVTYSLSNDGLGTLHELHVPKNLVLMAVAGISAESNPPPMVANERATIGALYMIANIEGQFKKGEGQGNFGSLETLIEKQMISKDFLEDHGYKIEVTTIGNKFEVTATPLEYGKTGKISYFIDDSNILRGADHGGGIASSADNPIQQ